jgi:hypothetical protein
VHTARGFAGSLGTRAGVLEIVFVVHGWVALWVALQGLLGGDQTTLPAAAVVLPKVFKVFSTRLMISPD